MNAQKDWEIKKMKMFGDFSRRLLDIFIYLWLASFNKRISVGIKGISIPKNKASVYVDLD